MHKWIQCNLHVCGVTTYLQKLLLCVFVCTVYTNVQVYVCTYVCVYMYLMYVFICVTLYIILIQRVNLYVYINCAAVFSLFVFVSYFTWGPT